MITLSSARLFECNYLKNWQAHIRKCSTALQTMAKAASTENIKVAVRVRPFISFVPVLWQIRQCQ